MLAAYRSEALVYSAHIDFDVYDQQGDKVATVRRNEVYMGNKADYTINGTMNRYTVTENATGTVICDIRKRADAEPAELEVSVRLTRRPAFYSTPHQTKRI